MNVSRRRTIAVRRSVSRLAGSVIATGLLAFTTGSVNPVDGRSTDVSALSARRISPLVVSATIDVAAVILNGWPRFSVSWRGAGITVITGRSVRTRGPGGPAGRTGAGALRAQPAARNTIATRNSFFISIPKS